MESTEGLKAVPTPSALLEFFGVFEVGPCSGKKFLEGPNRAMTVRTAKN